jgi:hypothetical protein
MSVRYCGRTFTLEQIDWLRTLIGEDPTLSRADLSRLACRQFNWLKADGGLKEMSARVAMLRMHDDGLIELPPPRCKRPDARIVITQRTDPAEAIEQPAHALAPLNWRQVQKRSQSSLWNEYIQRYHYLGYKTLPGAQLRYFVYTADNPVALLGFGAAAWQSAPRDRHIGWNHEERKRNLHLIVNNARFLILPWVQSKNLASMILAQAARILPGHWHERYGYRPLLLETFVEKARFQGTCYKAANWTCLGQTKGRGKLGPAGKQSVPIKDLLIYPLDRHFQNRLKR